MGNLIKPQNSEDIDAEKWKMNRNEKYQKNSQNSI